MAIEDCNRIYLPLVTLGSQFSGPAFSTGSSPAASRSLVGSVFHAYLISGAAERCRDNAAETTTTASMRGHDAAACPRRQNGGGRNLLSTNRRRRRPNGAAARNLEPDRGLVSRHSADELNSLLSSTGRLLFPTSLPLSLSFCHFRDILLTPSSIKIQVTRP